jgi:hypothetical protein
MSDKFSSPRWQAAPGSISQMTAILAEIAVKWMRSKTRDQVACEALDRALAELAPLSARPIEITARFVAVCGGPMRASASARPLDERACDDASAVDDNTLADEPVVVGSA